MKRPLEPQQAPPHFPRVPTDVPSLTKLSSDFLSGGPSLFIRLPLWQAPFPSDVSAPATPCRGRESTSAAPVWNPVLLSRRGPAGR